MAVDTAAKRFSIMDVCHPIRDGLPRPTGTVDAAERAGLLGLYSGIALGGGSPPVINESKQQHIGIKISIGL